MGAKRGGLKVSMIRFSNGLIPVEIGVGAGVGFAIVIVEISGLNDGGVSVFAVFV